MSERKVTRYKQRLSISSFSMCLVRWISCRPIKHKERRRRRNKWQDKNEQNCVDAVPLYLGHVQPTPPTVDGPLCFQTEKIRPSPRVQRGETESVSENDTTMRNDGCEDGDEWRRHETFSKGEHIHMHKTFAPKPILLINQGYLDVIHRYCHANTYTDN